MMYLVINAKSISCATRQTKTDFGFMCVSVPSVVLHVSNHPPCTIGRWRGKKERHLSIHYIDCSHLLRQAYMRMTLSPCRWLIQLKMKAISVFLIPIARPYNLCWFCFLFILKQTPDNSARRITPALVLASDISAAAVRWIWSAGAHAFPLTTSTTARSSNCNRSAITSLDRPS